ncbi:MAG: hypothetical protein GXO03_05240 [Aquificae bacterium]|nr:hypothetical protein [Aquificota bacterium]
MFSFLAVLLFVGLSFAQVFSVKLSELYGKEGLKLTGARASFSVTVPVNPLWELKRVRFFVYYASSPVLERSRSEAALFLNGKLLKAVKLGREGVLEATAEGRLFKEFNELELVLSQHYCLNCCENEMSPELWTYLDLERSYALFEYEERPFPLSLAFLREVYLSERLLGPLEFDVILERPSEELLKAAALLSGFLGSKIKFRKVFVNAVEELGDRNAFVLGSTRFVERLLGERAEGSLVLRRNPYAPSKFVLAFTGRTDGEVLEAVEGFILAPSAYLSESTVSVTRAEPPAFEPYESPVLLAPGKRLLLSELAGGELVLSGYGSKRELVFFVPPDLYLTPKEKLEIKLFYNHGLLVRYDSTVNLYLNGKFVYSIPVDPKDESDLKVARVKVPTSVLKKGFNALTIENALVPDKKDFCTSFNYENTKLVLYGNSYLQLPGLVHWTEMPYLEYFAATGFPFTVYPDMKGAAAVLERTDPETLSAFFTLTAFLGTRVQVPPFRLEVFVGRLPEEERELLFFWEREPSVERAVSGSGSVRLGSLLKGKEAGLELKGAGRKWTVAMRESPFWPGRTLLALNARSPEALNELTRLLYEPSVLGKVKGDTLYYEPKEKELYAFTSGERYFVGRMPFYKELSYRVGHDLKLLAGLALAGLLLFSYGLARLLRRRARQRLKEGEA